MSLDLFGDMVLVCGIVSSGILFIAVNLNYTPKDPE